MEPHRLPSETPTASRRGSTDLLYDNCPPCSLRRGGGCPGGGRPAAAGGLPAAPHGPQAGLAPAGAHVPTLPPGAGGSGPGARPDHSYCSWAGGRGAEGGWRDGRPLGEGAGGGGKEMDSPSPARSVDHHSVLSVYDNLREGAIPDDRATPTETRTLLPYSEDHGFLFPHSQDDGFLFPHSEDHGFLFPHSEDHGFLFPHSEDELRLLSAGPGAASRDSSPWSSCEIILAESRLSDGPDTPGGPGEGPSHALTASLPSLDRDQWDRGPSGGADPGPDQAAPAGVRVPPPVPLADPVARALRSVLTGLQHQMGRQRDEYEARISSLEQRNEELQSQLLGLKANLSQQRRWYQAVQAKIQESERARAAAETRNATIQREMDQFFDTFGELNNEARKAERIVRSF